MKVTDLAQLMAGWTANSDVKDSSPGGCGKGYPNLKIYNPNFSISFVVGDVDGSIVNPGQLVQENNCHKMNKNVDETFNSLKTAKDI